MINNFESIAYSDTVWDLHIHTNKCPKASSEFKDMATSQYVTKLNEIICNYPELAMISFTDHNCINNEVYSEFFKINNKVKVIPGIEVDIYLNQNDKNEDVQSKKYKHIIIYFDETMFKFDTHSTLLNEYLKNSPVVLADFLTFMTTKIKVPFLISPHFMKQDKRGIEYNWDEEIAKENIDLYIDQMCCFWETSNNTNIQYAISFLEEFERGNKVSIISFSDSNNFSKFEKYLNNPPQYFNSLPSFGGLRMVGTDCRRIHKNKHILSLENKSMFIGKIQQGDNNVIFMSQSLNSIIGGRGNGKSLLLDGIAYSLNPTKISNYLNGDRKKYVKKLNFKVYDLNGNELQNHKFNFDYYNQGYALDIFNKNGNINTNQYFKEKFDQLPSYDVQSVKQEIKDCINVKKCIIHDLENITGITSKVINLPLEKYDVKFNSKCQEVECLKYIAPIDIEEILISKKLVPNELRGNEVINKKINELRKVVYEEIYKFNEKRIFDELDYQVYNNYKNIKSKISDMKKDKNSVLDSLRKSIEQDFYKNYERIDLINNLISLATKNFNKECEIVCDGYKAKKFIFKRTLKCQNILNYLFEVFNNYFDFNLLKSRGINRKKMDDLLSMIEVYCYEAEKFMLESKNIDELDMELQQLESLKIEIFNDVIVDDGVRKVNLKNESPGTRANYLLEYIVFNGSGRPLLIDQPEDNIDNATIYNQLTNWINSLKNRRQVIVVTHDANIVVNADSENVVACSQINDDEFDYVNGALEYKNNLELISNILDGGKNAIERRLMKYGK